MSRQTIILLVSVVILGVSGLYLTRDSFRLGSITGPDKGNAPVVLYCAASNKAVIENIRQAYEKEFGRSIQVQYGPSQTLLSTIEVSNVADLYLPADDSYIDMGTAKNLLSESIPIATMQGVVAVRRGNPKNIAKLQDLLRDDVRFVQSSPDASAIGKLTRDILGKSQQWDLLAKKTAAFRTTVTDVANDLLVGAADAGVVYDSVLSTYPDLEFIRLPELDPIVSHVAVACVSKSAQPQAALHFARYVASRDRGQKEYAKFGFQLLPGDMWSDRPELTVFAGSMLRPAIDDVINAFEKREGVQVTRVYNGCGILVAQMKAGQRPDAYFACDKEFMSQVVDLFPKPVDVSSNELVILLQKGNPHGIRTLQDLTRKGLKVGIGHEKQCAMGWLTQNTIREAGIQRELMENVTVQAPTGDMLVNQLLAGSLDAAVVYISNAAGAGDKLEAKRIHGLACAIATQPFAVAEDSKFPNMTHRLFQKISSEESKEIFTAEGFQWQLNRESEKRNAE